MLLNVLAWIANQGVDKSCMLHPTLQLQRIVMFKMIDGGQTNAWQALFVTSTNKHNSQQMGFTLVELMVVIIVIGILGAIALPSFLNQAARARHGEAVTHLAAINRGQQAFYQENLRFADSMAELGLTYLETDSVYTYTFQAPQEVATVATETVATPDKPALRGFVGAVYVDVDEYNQQVFSALLCQGAFGSIPSLTYSESDDNLVQISGCDQL